MKRKRTPEEEAEARRLHNEKVKKSYNLNRVHIVPPPPPKPKLLWFVVPKEKLDD